MTNTRLPALPFRPSMLSAPLAAALGLTAAVASAQSPSPARATRASPPAAANAVATAPTAPAVSHSAAVSASAAGTTAPTETGARSDKAPAEPAPADSSASLGPIERLPPSAYPTYRVRGIYGGSLWMIFHGLQWPYYPKTGIGVSGYAWIDTGYERLSYSNPNDTPRSYLLQQGRFLLRVTPTYTSGDYFIQAQAELVANKDQFDSQATHTAQDNVVDADDVWVRAGRWNKWDVQLGRFEGWEVYHLGMGLDINTIERIGAYSGTTPGQPPDIYGVTYAFYRPPKAGQLAFHLYPFDFLRFEVQGQVGADEHGRNLVGTRPVGILDFGWVKLKVGGEYLESSDQLDATMGQNQVKVKSRGAGAGIVFIADPRIEGGVNAARGLVDATTTGGDVDGANSYTITSFGGFVNVRIVGDLIFGLGANYTKKDDLHYQANVNDVGHFAHLQAFAALQYVVAKQLFIKAVAAYARAELQPSDQPADARDFINTMGGGRLRVMYLF